MLNKNNALNIAFALNIEVTFNFLITALSLYPNIIYEWLTLTAIYCINFLVTVFNFYLILVLCLVSITYKNKAITDIL